MKLLIDLLTGQRAELTERIDAKRRNIADAETRLATDKKMLEEYEALLADIDLGLEALTAKS